MPKDGAPTRVKIMDTAQLLIMQRGYSGVSIDSIIDAVGITKGAFFYHFKSKNELAKALIQRYHEADNAIYAEFTERAQKLSRDPLQSMLIYIGLFEEMFDNYQGVYPGCLFASYIYEMQQFDEATQQIIRDSFFFWRNQLKTWFDEIAAQYPPKLEADTTYLADMLTSTLEGAFIMAKAMDDEKSIPQQLRQFKNYVELLFSP